MTDERLERALSDAIADLAGTSAPDYLDDILERTSRTRQRPWWTFPGRYLTMNMTPTLKFATAVALAFVLGIGIAPLILPSSEGTSVGPPGAESPSPSPSPDGKPPADPVEFTARLGFGPGGDGRPTKVGAIAQHRGGLFWPTVVDASDPRLEGSARLAANSDSYPDAEGMVVWHLAFRIENEAGAWQEVPSVALTLPDGTALVWTSVFEGEGAYEGLTAIAEVTLAGGGWDLRGVIIDGAIPPSPILDPGE